MKAALALLALLTMSVVLTGCIGQKAAPSPPEPSPQVREKPGVEAPIQMEAPSEEEMVIGVSNEEIQQILTEEPELSVPDFGEELSVDLGSVI